MSKLQTEVKHGNAYSMGVGDSDIGGGFAFDFSDSDFGDLYSDEPGVSSIQPGDLGDSQDLAGARRFNFELNDIESTIVRLTQGAIAGSRGRVATAKTEKVYITHEDFEEGPERDAFLLIFGYAEHLFESAKKNNFSATSTKKLKALRFFFCRTLKEINLHDAAECLDGDIRIDVLRLRFMFEFWLRGWSLPPMPEDAEGLPSRIELMAAKYEGTIGISIAREAWFEPGIEASALLHKVLDGRGENIQRLISKAFDSMTEDYLLSLSENKVYLTGKNPILELEDKLTNPNVRSRGQLANIYWSRRF
jgi:hypothetical protein